MDQKQIDEYNSAKAAADAEDGKTNVSDADIKSLDDKLLNFATGLSAAERKHLFTMLDKGADAGGDVQGFWWRDTFRLRWWHGPWGRRYWHR